MVLVLLTSLNCCMSTLRLVHYALLLTPACWKSNNTNARFMAFAPSLALDPTRDYVIRVPSFVLQIWPTLSRKMCLTILKCSTLRYDSQIIDCNYRFVAIFCLFFCLFLFPSRTCCFPAEHPWNSLNFVRSDRKQQTSEGSKYDNRRKKQQQ